MTERVPRDPPPKSRLTCPECDYENPIDGDWVVEPADGRIAYRCPNCSLVLTVRGRTDAIAV